MARDLGKGQRDIDRANAKHERARRHAYNELLVKILQRLSPDEIQQFGERLLERYFREAR